MRPQTENLSLASIRTDGGTQPRINQDWKIIGEYAQDMREGATFPPVIVYFDGKDYWLADGFHRYHAAKQAERETIEAEIRQGTLREAILFSVGVNAHHGFRRTNADKHAAVEKLLRDEEWSRWNDSEIARRCCVHQSTVSRARQNLSYALHKIEIPQERLVERNGTTYSMDTANIGHSQPSMLEWYSRHDNNPTERASLADIFDPVANAIPTIYLPKPLDEPRRNIDNVPIAVPHIISKNNEWYTPFRYVEAARKLMHGIDLDPASCESANVTVQATLYYDISTNGLTKDWTGRVWLNPPYGYTDGKSNQAIWSGRLIDQFKNKITAEAVLLVNAAVDTKWFQDLFEFPVCLTLGRINFSTPESTLSGSTHGSAFVYFGSQLDRFAEIFSEFGTVVKRW